MDPIILSLRSDLSLKIVVQEKIANREILVKKYGEEAFDKIVQSKEALILFINHPCRILCICIFV